MGLKEQPKDEELDDSGYRKLRRDAAVAKKLWLSVSPNKVWPWKLFLIPLPLNLPNKGKSVFPRKSNCGKIQPK